MSLLYVLAKLKHLFSHLLYTAGLLILLNSSSTVTLTKRIEIPLTIILQLAKPEEHSLCHSRRFPEKNSDRDFLSDFFSGERRL